MSILRWSFVILNVVVCLGCLWSTKWSYNGFGERQKWTDPSNWIWVWQLVGVCLVLYFKLSPWHLLWWFVIGYPMCVFFGRILGYKLS